LDLVAYPGGLEDGREDNAERQGARSSEEKRNTRGDEKPKRTG
jgi:hypothetical protein